MSVHRLVKFCFFTSKICLAAIILGAVLTVAPVSAGEISISASNNSLSIIQGKKKTIASNSRFLANGTHLYGETDQPNKPDSEYVVFENKSGKVFGAVFLANSEFSCFHGEVRPGQLEMMVIDSNADAAHPYAVNIRTDDAEVSVAEYKQVKKIGKKDLNLLESCRSMYKNSHWKSSLRG
jgi:hypothetical protein